MIFNPDTENHLNKFEWRKWAIQTIKADVCRSSETNLLRLIFPHIPKIHLYLKDESNHKTGSLKHRLARSLFVDAIIHGKIGKDTIVVEASSGNTAVSEAYYAQLLGLKFIAVLAKTTSPAKMQRIRQLGGECHLVESSEQDRQEARRLANELGGHFMDQFTNAEKALISPIAHSNALSIIEQMKQEPFPLPKWIVCGIGTGDTALNAGRYIIFNNLPTRICAVDPENSVYYDAFMQKDRTITSNKSPIIEGIGRRSVEASFNPSVIHRMIKVPDAASIAAIHFIKELTGISCGGSSGTCLWGALQLISEMVNTNLEGSIVSMLCDSGKLYENTYYSSSWLKKNQLDIDPYLKKIWHFYHTAEWR